MQEHVGEQVEPGVEILAQHLQRDHGVVGVGVAVAAQPPMKSMASLICWALRVLVPSVSRSAVRLATPALPSGSRRAPASSTTRTSTIGRLRCSETSSAAPLGSVSCTTGGPSAGGERGE